MAAPGGSALRRTGQVLTGFAALLALGAVLVGAPAALLAFAGNPLPDHLPTLAEAGSVLTSRDDGRLFLRALALAGWFGWATFAFSVLVELGAHLLRRPAPRLPGMRRQQRAAAALVGSIALIIAASPAATAATAVAGPYAAPAAVAPMTLAAPVTAAPAPAAPVASAPVDDAAPRPAEVYRVAKGDYLGEVAERYLDEFEDYRELAKLNRLGDPDRIRPGQLLKLPAQATDQGARPHAAGRLVARPAAPAPARPAPAPERTVPERTTPEQVTPQPPAAEMPDEQTPTVSVGAARPAEVDRVNRPLAVSAVLAVASIVGAQIGAVLGLRRRPATVRAGGRFRGSAAGAGRGPGPAAGTSASGRHRRD